MCIIASVKLRFELNWVSTLHYSKLTNMCVGYIIVRSLYTSFHISLSLSLANFHIPTKDDIFQEVQFTEIYGQAANKIVQQYKDDALGLPSFPQHKRGRYERYDRPPGPPGRFGPPRLGGWDFVR